ncbi:LAMI_0B02674g1_1 [Lachancea mirantina]|uniref:LAMI_0B02674g1_1 n=1 Tax=Lachancea mirantina TaxID=1230905 RepID=A0A1G4IU98_9SACH|nr:LAMI_0B02674g1_1 [Lachancea mirantina]
MVKKHQIRIPGQILDEVNEHDFDDTSRFEGGGRKRKTQLGRKERRKQERAAKRQHKNANRRDKVNSVRNVMAKDKDIGQESVENDNEDEDDKDENDSDREVFEGFSDINSEQELQNSDGSSIGAISDIGEVGDEEDEMSMEETMKALAAMKDKKQTKPSKEAEPNADYSDKSVESEEEVMTVEETIAALKNVKDKKNHKEKTKKASSDPVLTPYERAQAKREEEEMNYYAKKLGLKGKHQKLTATDDFDVIGGLLEDLPYFQNYGEESSFGPNQVSASESEEDDADEDHGANPYSEDDELSSGDFDEFSDNDLNEEEWNQLRELEGSDDDEEEETNGVPREKENPYVAPTSGANVYVSLSMRKKDTSDGESAEVAAIKRKIKSSLNKLSETNLIPIISALNDLYGQHPRQYVTEQLIKQVVEIIASRNKLLDGFILTYAATIFSLWKLRGNELGASFIQYFIEKLLERFQIQERAFEAARKAREESDVEPVVFSKECRNLVTLLAYCYNLGLISSVLVYDVVRMLIKNPNEFSIDLLLRIVSVSGQLIRGDDPAALKEIMTELLQNVSGTKHSLRMEFLLETMSDLKNNRLKPSIQALSHNDVKKAIQPLTKSSSASSTEPIQVSLDDIKNVDSRGKWWLVGASWKGNMNSAFDIKTGKEETGSRHKNRGDGLVINDTLLEELPDWDTIARQHRMNTDVRRAVFVSVMSAQDFMDAFTMIEKLNLKNRQSAEIPKVIIHCLSAESRSRGFNPYYTLLSSKLCENNHHVLKAFQFAFWNVVKKLEAKDVSDSETDDSDNEIEDEDMRLRKYSNLARLFGGLLADSTLKLDLLKHVPIMGGLNSDGLLFIEVLFFEYFMSIAKRSEIKTGKGAAKKVTFNNDMMYRSISNGIRQENRTVILKALKWFLKDNLHYEKYLSTGKSDKMQQRETLRIEWALGNFQRLLNEELGVTEY